MVVPQMPIDRPKYTREFSPLKLYEISTDSSKTCIFCPNVEGAFKQSNTLRWAHLLCAIWIPEVSLGNQTFMEPVEGVEKVPKGRWKLVSCQMID